MPQLEDGYTRIANELLDAMISHRIAGEQMQCFLFILRKTYGYGKKEDQISLSQFVEATGMIKPHVCRAIKNLESFNIVVTKKGNKINTTYSINKNYKSWKVLPKKVTLPKKVMAVTKKGNKKPKSLPKKVHTKESIKETITKEIKKTPCTLKEWQDFGFEYANKYFDFPISKVKCDSLTHNSYDYWFNQEYWWKKKMKDWKSTVQGKIRKENIRLKDWDASKNVTAIEEC